MLGMHITFSTYGFWPPNDPRGSWSTEVRAQHLYRIGGAAIKVATSRSVAGRPHDYQLRLGIQRALKYPPVALSGKQARAVGDGIGIVSRKTNLAIFALAVLLDHVHLVVGEHRIEPDELIACLQRAATKQLNLEAIHPLKRYARPNGKLPTPWTKQGWTVFLDTDEAMRRAIRYVEMNPMRAGLPSQRWSCVQQWNS